MIFVRHTYTDGSQSRLEMRRRRRYQMDGYRQFPEMVGGITAAESQSQAETGIRWTAIMTGVITGASVWLVTRILDRVFEIERK